MNYNVLFILLIILLLIVNTSKKTESFISSNTISKTVIMTYHLKEKIPLKVYKNVKKYAPNYRLIIYNDNQVIKFLTIYYPKNVLEAFYQLKGAHKADLFRYCYLYKYGGVYVDVKTEFIKNINDIFNLKDIDLYTVLSKNKGTIYQGIIASIPKNPIFKELIEFMVTIKKPVTDYLIFTRHFYHVLSNNNTISLKEGSIIKYKNTRVYLYKEICSDKSSDCYDGLDRHNLCCYVYDNNEKIIKTRYSDYPF